MSNTASVTKPTIAAARAFEGRGKMGKTSLSAAGVTLTASQVLGGLIITSATGAYTLPTAASVVAACNPPPKVNETFDLVFVNNNVTGSTLVASASITHDTTTNTILASGTAVFRFKFTNVTSGTEAMTVVKLSNATTTA
jgi:hypothetical protein